MKLQRRILSLITVAVIGAATFHHIYEYLKHNKLMIELTFPVFPQFSIFKKLNLKKSLQMFGASEGMITTGILFTHRERETAIRSRATALV